MNVTIEMLFRQTFISNEGSFQLAWKFLHTWIILYWSIEVVTKKNEMKKKTLVEG